MNRKYLAAVLAAATAAATLSACTKSSPSSSSSDNLVIAARKTPNGIDHDFNYTPEDHQIRAAVYDKLIALGTETDDNDMIVPSYDSSKLEGRLAESWKLSDGGRTITFTLRKGVKSEAGNELTANDLQYTWDRSWGDKGVGSFYAQNVLGITKPSWKVVSKYEWSFSTPKVNSLTTLMFVNNDLDVLDAKVVKSHATTDDPWAKKWLATHSAGFGAYRVTKFAAGNEVDLSANRNYYGEKPSFDKVIYREVPEDANRLSLVQSGQADVAEWLGPRFVSQAEKSSDVKVWTTHGNTMFRLDFNWEKAPLDNPTVRKALIYATPDEQIRKQVFYGLADQERSAVPSTYPGYSGDHWPYSHNPAKAKELLQSAGVSNLNFDLYVDSGDTTQQDAAVLVRSAFAKAGVSVTIKPLSSASFTSQLYSGKFDMNFQPAFPILPDAGYALLVYYPCGSLLNATHYCNKDFQNAVYAANQTLDKARSDALYAEAQKIMNVDDGQAAWIAEVQWNLVTRKNLTGVNWDTPNIYQLRMLKRSDS